MKQWNNICMLKLYNSLSRQVEEFKPLSPSQVTMYTCGPTVYDFAHIGNFRTYMTSDTVIRTLKLNEYEVKFYMNLTDVGHLTGDNLGDADTGEDRMEKSARKEGKSAWEIADFYTSAFLEDFKELNLTQPKDFIKATAHIPEQIELVRTLLQKGFAYEISDGIYFDTSRFHDYGKLSNLDEIKEGARVEINPEKRNPRDFALWKYSNGEKRQMEWYFDGSKSGVLVTEKNKDQVSEEERKTIGFPGWHIECSAMSMKYLGDTLDIHAGGIDLRETHHPNEIAQSEAATGKPFTHFWVHSSFMLIQGQRMSKSLGNNYRLYDLEKEGFEPLALRYLYLQTHYRQEMNFTFSSLEAAQNALNHLRKEVLTWEEGEGRAEEFEKRFKDAMNDDLNTPQALSVVWDLVKADIPSAQKLNSLYFMDEILGLRLKEYRLEKASEAPISIPDEVRELAEERHELRQNRQFAQADQLRNKILKLGFEVVDTEKGFEIKKA